MTRLLVSNYDSIIFFSFLFSPGGIFSFSVVSPSFFSLSLEGQPKVTLHMIEIFFE